ncbi:MAG: immunoglobulin domain-containing protein [Holophagaceae bacterium]|nr:immunoglobulin domain-containing protein [Holophagaceae bacterium]
MPIPAILRSTPVSAILVLTLALLLACGGGGGGGGNPAPGGGGTNTAPAITGQPAASTVTLGQAAAFTVSASGNPAPSFQWERSGDGSAWTGISGATGAAFTFQPAKADHTAQFRAKASNVAGTATSNAAALTVQWAPAFTTQPTTQAISSPAPATFSALAEANPPATYQWQSSTDSLLWTDQPGATASTFQTGPTSPAMNNLQVRCVATNAVGSATSSAVTLLVNVPTFTLTVTVGTGATGTPAATAVHALGTAVNYAYTAQPGFTNLQVLLDGTPVAAAGILVMNGAHTLAVTAAPIQRTVTFTAGAGGTLTGSTVQTVANGGSTSPVTAVPDGGFNFVNWTGAGFATSTANPLTLAGVTQDFALTATFSAVPPVTFLLTVNRGNGVAGTPAAGGSFAQGTVVPFSYTVLAGFTNLAVTVDGAPVAAAGTVTMNAAHTLAATAQALPSGATIVVGSGGFVFAPDEVTVTVGTPVTFHWAASGHSMVIGNPCSPSGVLDSGIRSSGFELVFTPTVPGDVPFFCSPHCGLGMTGVIHVNP